MYWVKGPKSHFIHSHPVQQDAFHRRLFKVNIDSDDASLSSTRLGGCGYRIETRKGSAYLSTALFTNGVLQIELSVDG